MKLIIAIVIHCMALTFNAANAAVDSSPKREIVAIKGLLYYNDSGEWSQNIFDEKFDVWSSEKGDSTFKGNAESTLFVVEANGQSGDKVKIKITQTLKNKTTTVLDTTKKLSVIDGKTTKVPLLVDDTTAGEYAITATVIDAKGKAVSEAKTAKIKFGGK